VLTGRDLAYLKTSAYDPDRTSMFDIEQIEDFSLNWFSQGNRFTESRSSPRGCSRGSLYRSLWDPIDENDKFPATGLFDRVKQLGRYRCQRNRFCLCIWHPPWV